MPSKKSQSRRSRVPATAATQSFAAPICSYHVTDEFMQRDPGGKWVCMKCADEWLEAHVEAKLRHKTQGGVLLPVGVKDERRVTPSFRDAYPNRRARRAARAA